MNQNFRMIGRSLLSLHDLADDELLSLIDLSVELKRKKAVGQRDQLLAGKHIAMIFEKMSTRTRCAIAVAMADEGGVAEALMAGEIHLGKKESVVDTARVLGRMFDGIMFRGFEQRTAELLAAHSGVPVWNALTDDCHPTQALADLMTAGESLGDLKGLKLVYVGDGRNNVANSLMTACAKVGMWFVNCAPESLSPDRMLVDKCSGIAEKNGAGITVDHVPASAVQGANIVYTDVWVSMGEESKKEERLSLLRPYQVTMDLMQATGNLENDRVIFLHCLPAFHDNNTEVTKDTGALEVTDDVFEAPFSKVFDQAENRVHTTKAVFVASLCDQYIT